MSRSRPPRVGAGLLLAGLLALSAGALSPAPASAASTDATLTVVHGVRGLVADVGLDGQQVLAGFAPERVTDPLTVPAGTHRVQVWASGSDRTAGPVLDQTITLSAGQRATAGVGLAADGTPVITVFDDAELLPAAGSTALGVRGLAAAAPVRVAAGSLVLSPSLAPGSGGAQQVSPGTYEVSAVPVAGGDPVVPPQQVPVTAGRAVVLYLIGSQADGTLGWVAQTVRPGASGAPARVDTGVGPPPSSGLAGEAALVPLALLLAGVPLVLAARRRA